MNRLHDYVLNIIIQLIENRSYLLVLAVQSVLREVWMDFFFVLPFSIRVSLNDSFHFTGPCVMPVPRCNVRNDEKKRSNLQ